MICARFKCNIGAADVDDLSMKNKSMKNLLCVVDAFPKYDWVKALKDRKLKARKIPLPKQ